MPLLLRLERRSGALRPQILAELAPHGRPLRWAITAVDTDAAGVQQLQIEAVVLA